MIPLLIYAQASDLVTFYFAASVLDINGEWGILAHAIYPLFGLLGMMVAKVILVVLVAAGTYGLVRADRRKGLTVGICAIAVGSLGFISNVAALAVSV